MPDSPPSHDDDLRRIRGEARDKGYDRAYDQARRAPGTDGALLHRLRHDSRWERVRTHVLARDPLCVSCQARGLVRPATQVDHVELAADIVRVHGPNAFFEAERLQGLCGPCHGRKSARERHPR